MVKIVVNKETGEFVSEVTETPDFGVTVRMTRLGTGEVLTEEKEVTEEELERLKNAILKT